MRTLTLIFFFFCSCSRDPQQRQQSNSDLILNKSWKTIAYTHNGVSGATVVAQQPTFQFRSDSKVYFSQINPVFRDTLNFVFINDDNIKLTKPSVSSTYSINLK
jgi:hypothetical protein